MDVSHPIADVVPSAHGPVLAVLAATSTPLTGRAVAGLTRPRVSQPRVAAILNDLARAGLVIRTPAGSASLFTLNREHLAAGPVQALASLRAQLWDRIADHAAGWPHPPAAVIVFGSAARGDGGPGWEILVVSTREKKDWSRTVPIKLEEEFYWMVNSYEKTDPETGRLRFCFQLKRVAPNEIIRAFVEHRHPEK